MEISKKMKQGEFLMKNNLCDHGHSTSWQVRLLPNSDDPDGGNQIVCYGHYCKEIAYRKYRNAELQEPVFKLPSWEELKIYE